MKMTKKRFWISLLILCLMLSFLAGNIVILIYYGYGSWNDRVSLVLEIIGFYGIGIGFIQTSDKIKKILNFNDFTSPDPLRYIAGNFYFLALFFSVLGVSLEYRSGKGNQYLGCLGQIFIFCLLPFFFIYALFHMLIIAPFAYIGYIFVSAIVESIIGAEGDTEFTFKSPGEENKRMRIKESIASNPAAAKSFLIGIPALVVGLVIKGIGIFL